MAVLAACVFGDLLSPRVVDNLSVQILTDSLLTVGDTVKLLARAVAGADPVAGVRFRFASTRPSVASVDDSGRVAVLARDTFAIRATLASGSLAGEPPETTKVFRGIVARVVASADSVRFESLGDTLRLSAQGQTKQGATIPGVRITWTSSFSAAATVDSAGLVTAVANTAAPGLRVIASADGRVDTVRVRVQQVSRSITLSQDTVVLRNAGDTARVVAQPRDARGNLNIRSPTTWSSTNVGVFTVDSTGLVRATGEGIALVVARSDAVADTGRVVVARGLLSLDVTPDSSLLTALGDQVVLAATAVDEANNAVSSPVILWRSLEPGVATVSGSGVVTAASNGTAHIVGSSGGREDTTVVVVDQVLAAVEIRRPASDTTLTSLGDTMRVVAEGRDRNGFALPPDRCCAFIFSSDNATVASVDAGGFVTAHTNGSATISAEAGGFIGSRVISVAQEVASVQVTPRRVSLTPGQQAQLNAAAFDARGNLIPGRGFNWVSRNTGVANPTSNGADTVSVQAGNVNDSTRVVASTGGRSDSAVVRVGNLAALCVGGTPHQGTISAPETWTRAQSPHCVAGSILLRAATLTIEAGATVKFAAGAEIQVGQCCTSGQSARIRANGTTALPITFTALDANPSRGQWGGIRAHWVAPNDSLIFRNALFEYGGAGNLATVAQANTCQGTVVLEAVTIRESRNDAVRTSCSLTVTNSVIENNSAKAIAAGGGTARITGSRLRSNYQGLSIEGTASLATLAGTRITSNADFGLMVTPGALNAIQDVPVDSLIGNGRDEIRVNGSGDLVARDLVVDRRLPWFLDGARVGLGAGRTLTIDPGTAIRAVGGSTIWVGASSSDGSTDIGGGRIVADGSMGEIRFTSGNPNPQPGDWGLIWIKRLSDTTVFRNVVLEYGGPCCFGGHILAEHTGAPLVLDRVTSRRSRLQGVHVSGPLIVQGPIYADSNASDGLEVNVPGVTIADSRFVGNGNHGVRAGTGATNLTIRNSDLSKNSGDGAWLSGDNTVVQGSLFAENACNGLRISPSGNNPANPVVSGNTIRANGCNGLELGGSIVPRVENNLIADNGGIGAVVHDGGAVFGNRIRGNQYPLVVKTAALGALARQNIDSLLGNQRDTLWIQCCGQVSASDTLRTSSKLPWRFDAPSNVRFVSPTVWKLEPGATVVMNGGVLQVDNATIRAEGEVGNPIRFTSDNPNPGAWSYLDFQARADTSVLRHVEFRYGGGGGGGAGFTLRVAGAPSKPVVLDNVRVTRSSSVGIQIDDETIIPTRVVADSNAGDGMRTLWSGALVIPDGDFSYNGGHGFFATSDLSDKIQINGGRFSGNGQSGIKLCGDSTTIRNATLTRNFSSGLEVQGANCPGGVTLQGFVVDGVRADSNGNGITYLAGSGMRIRNTRIVGNAGSGVNVGYGLEEFTANRVTLNGSYPISIGAYGLQALEDQNVDSMLGNAIDQILVQQDGTIASRDVTIRRQLPWRVQAFVTIGGGHTLTVEPGTTIRMDGGSAGLWIGGGPSGGQGQGRLLAEGTATDPIRFVPVNTSNRWHVLAISEQSDTSKLRHVRVEHGGNSGWPGALTISDAMGRPVILDSVIVRQSAGVGISAGNIIAQGPVYADSNGGRGMVLYGRDVTLRDSRFVGNGGDGLWSAASARKLTILRSLFYRNFGLGAQLNGDSTTIDSTTIRRNGSGVSFCCDGNNPTRPSLLRSVVDSNTAGGVSTAGSTNGVIQSNQIVANGGVGLTHHNGGLVTGNRIRGN
ncbi:MAG TPA: right-handed parallel beta-helix repeat-containing protein, partial [Gemmatimonadales bacterium]|nr:right-handed parallel beta-helix repeat-containing protein [Gemmatimonadales bacterium]